MRAAPKPWRKCLSACTRRGYIYKGSRIINWCPKCKTSLSDAEVEHEEQEGHFWHIKYPIVGTDRFLEIATTRPETMLGDTAIAVHPDDERYTDIVGKNVILPLVGRRSRSWRITM